MPSALPVISEARRFGNSVCKSMSRALNSPPVRGSQLLPALMHTIGILPAPVPHQELAILVCKLAVQ